MTPEQKTEKLFGIFTGCYGAPEMKDGQDIKYVGRIWAIMLERYDWEVIKQAVTSYMANAKWNRWPSPGDFKVLCEEFSKLSEKPKDVFSTMPEDWKRDLNAFSRWWNTLPPSTGLFTKDVIICHFFKKQNITGDFSHCGVTAYRMGIQDKWIEVVDEYMGLINANIKKQQDAMGKGMTLSEVNSPKFL